MYWASKIKPSTSSKLKPWLLLLLLIRHLIFCSWLGPVFCWFPTLLFQRLTLPHIWWRVCRGASIKTHVQKWSPSSEGTSRRCSRRISATPLACFASTFMTALFRYSHYIPPSLVSFLAFLLHAHLLLFCSTALSTTRLLDFSTEVLVPFSNFLKS